MMSRHAGSSEIRMMSDTLQGDTQGGRRAKNKGEQGFPCHGNSTPAETYPMPTLRQQKVSAAAMTFSVIPNPNKTCIPVPTCERWARLDSGICTNATAQEKRPLRTKPCVCYWYSHLLPISFLYAGFCAHRRRWRWRWRWLGFIFICQGRVCCRRWQRAIRQQVKFGGWVVPIMGFHRCRLRVSPQDSLERFRT